MTSFPALDKLKSGRDFDRGRKLFAAAKCFACHRFDNEGGSNGPDLTGVAAASARATCSNRCSTRARK